MTNRKMVYFAFFSIVFLLYSPPAYANVCERFSPKISIHSAVSSVTYDRGRNSAELTNMHESYRHGSLSVLGLTGGGIETDVSAEMKAIAIGGNLYCLEATHIQSKFHAVPKIYIASNFKRGSCEYGSVLRHEEKHVKVLKQMHKQYVPIYRRALYNAVKALPEYKPFQLQDLETAKSQLIADLSVGMQEPIQKMLSDVAKRQQAIDTQEEYRAVLSRCKKWDKKLNKE